MSSLPPSISLKPNTAIVSRFAAFPALVLIMGLASRSDPVFTRPHPEDVRGCHVICDSIDLELGSFATAVTRIPLNLPEECICETTPLHLLAQYAGKPQTYAIRPSSTGIVTQYQGGLTPSSLHAAQELSKAFGLHSLVASDLAAMLDSLYFDERTAGSATEQFYLRILAASHARATGAPLRHESSVA